MSQIGRAAGRFQHLRGKGAFWVELLRSWIMPGAAAGAFAKYLGVQGRWSIAVAVALPLLVEALGFLIGRFLYDHGGTEEDYAMAMRRDPYKRESLAELRRIAAILHDAQIRAGRLQGPVDDPSR